MNHDHSPVTLLLLLWCVSFGSTVQAEQAVPPADAEQVARTVQEGVYTEKGADTCIKCHDEDAEYPVFDIFKTKHGTRGDKRAPFAGLQCEACHGPGSRHVEWAEIPPMARPNLEDYGLVVSTATMSSRDEVELCAPCHSRRTELGDYNHTSSSLMESLVPEYDLLGHVRERTGASLPGIVPSGTYPCADGRHVVIRPLAYCSEQDIERYAETREFPIIPCNLCGSQPNLQRQAIKAMLKEWRKQHPGRIENIFRAIGNVSPSQLADHELFDFIGLGAEPAGAATTRDWLMPDRKPLEIAIND